MTPPHVPGAPGLRLPEPWETEVAELKRRLQALEEEQTRARVQLQSYNDAEEDSQIKIPSDAPARAKVALGALAGLTPTGRAVVILVLGLAAIAAATLLVLRGVKLF